MGYFDADAEDMLEVYLLETRQLTGQLSAVLLEAEKKNAFAEEDIHSIFRIMHTIKSSSAMMGFRNCLPWPTSLRIFLVITEKPTEK